MQHVRRRRSTRDLLESAAECEVKRRVRLWGFRLEEEGGLQKGRYMGRNRQSCSGQ